MGTLGDRIGRRRLLLIGSGAFALTSLLAAYSTSPEMLIAARALQGVAGATLVPCAMALLFTMFTDERQRGTALGVMMGCFAVGAALGPVLGGVLLESFWWGSVFLINVPVMAVVLLAGPRLLPEYRAPDAGRPDLASVALSLVALLGVIYGIKRVAQDGVDAAVVATVLVGIAAGVAFLRRQGRLRDPLVDLGLFRSPRFSAALAIAVRRRVRDVRRVPAQHRVHAAGGGPDDAGGRAVARPLGDRGRDGIERRAGAGAPDRAGRRRRGRARADGRRLHGDGAARRRARRSRC